MTAPAPREPSRFWSITPAKRPTKGTPERAYCDAMLEEELQQRVLALAQENGWHRYHPTPATVRQRGRWVRLTHQLGESGFPDLVLARDGIVLFWELKREDGHVEDDQRAWLGNLGRNTAVVRPRDLPEVRRILRAPRRDPQGPPPPRPKPKQRTTPAPRTGNGRTLRLDDLDQLDAVPPRTVRVADL